MGRVDAAAPRLVIHARPVGEASLSPERSWARHWQHAMVSPSTPAPPDAAVPTEIAAAQRFAVAIAGGSVRSRPRAAFLPWLPVAWRAVGSVWPVSRRELDCC